ncbi:MAG: SsrA-binding protein SmpB [Gammaproteobacteria bacterium]|jgi:SsrA-binding protein
MRKNKSGSRDASSTIALNKKARHDYFIEDRFEAGLALQGWEVKSLRAGGVQLTEAYILIKDNQAWLFGVHIRPLASTSTHTTPDPARTRRLLLHRRELDRLVGAVERKGYTLIPLALYWKHGLAKLEIALARGKHSHDKRAAAKERDWQREKQRLLRRHQGG